MRTSVFTEAACTGGIRRPVQYDSPDMTEPPVPDKVIRVLLRGRESKDLDYKGPMGWSEGDKGACCSLVKDILAMANTLGGFIVIGVSEQPTGYSLEGISADQAKSFDTSRLNRFLQAYTDPPYQCLPEKSLSRRKNLCVDRGAPIFRYAAYMSEGLSWCSNFTCPIRSH